MKTTGPACKNCYFFRQEYGREPPYSNFDQGDCRLHGPIAPIEIANCYNSGKKALWPQVKGDDYCGDFQQNEEIQDGGS